MSNFFTPVILGILLLDSYLLNFSSIASEYLHTSCLNLTAGSDLLHVAQSALLCGNKNMSADMFDILKNTGILHWFVVSGSHLVFLELYLNKLFRWLKRIQPNKQYVFDIVHLSLLYMYCLTAAANAPILRAFIHLLLQKQDSDGCHFTSPHVLSLLSGLITLVIRPDFFNSLSFYLSWMAAYFLQLSYQVFKGQLFWVHVSLYVGLAPLLMTLGIAHPFSIIIQFGLTMFFSEILFPLTLASVILPFLNPLTEFLWRLKFLLLTQLSPILPPLAEFGDFVAWIACLVIVGMHITFFRLDVWRQRKLLCRS